MNPFEPLRVLARHHSLIRQLAARDIAARYKGSIAGVAWAFITPILMLLVYTFVFAVVFDARWPGTGTKTDFALVLFCGLIIFMIFSECTNRASTLIQANTNYVKKVRFPLEILVPVTLLTALFHAAVSLLVLLFALLALRGSVPLTFPLVFVAALPCVFLTLGISWVVASTAVYLKDTAQIVVVGTTALMFLSPLFFPPQAVPEEFQALMSVNPLASMIQDMRAVALLGEVPDLFAWLRSLVFSYLFAWGGFAYFDRLRRGFADIL